MARRNPPSMGHSRAMASADEEERAKSPSPSPAAAAVEWPHFCIYFFITLFDYSEGVRRAARFLSLSLSLSVYVRREARRDRIKYMVMAAFIISQENAKKVSKKKKKTPFGSLGTPPRQKAKRVGISKPSQQITITH